MSRDSMIFYKSFYESAQLLGEKARLRFYDAIFDLSFSEYETVTKLVQNCDEIGSKLERFRNVFAQFNLVKPYLLNSGKQYINGKKGGAPKGNLNAKKQPKNKQIEIEEEIEIENNNLSLNNIGENEREILYKYIDKQPGIHNRDAYLTTMIQNGTYKNILETEKSKQKECLQRKENAERQREQDMLKVNNKISAAYFCCRYWKHTGENQDEDIEELVQRYNLPLTYSNLEQLYHQESKK